MLEGNDTRGGAFAIFLRPHPGAFRQLKCPHPGEFSHFFFLKKCLFPVVSPAGGGGGGDAWALLEID